MLRRVPRSPLARALVLAFVAGCYESHVADVPANDAGHEPTLPGPEGGPPLVAMDAGPPTADASGPDADVSAPDVDAGPPPSCEAPQPVWAFGAGDDGFQYPRDTAMDAAGNTYVG